jgi:hypothetical protein
MCHRKERLDSFFAEIVLDVRERKTNIRAHIVSTLQSSAQGRQNFLAKCFRHAYEAFEQRASGSMQTDGSHFE